MVEIQDEYGRPIGQFNTESFHRPPAIIHWQGRIFQRYGKVNDYHYTEERVVTVDPSAIELY